MQRERTRGSLGEGGGGNLNTGKEGATQTKPGYSTLPNHPLVIDGGMISNTF